MMLDLDAFDITGIVEREVGKVHFEKIFPQGIDKSKVVAILQPEYTLVDLHNTYLSPELSLGGESHEHKGTTT